MSTIKWRLSLALSRRKQGFESPRERQSFQLLREEVRKANRALPIFCLLFIRNNFMTETCDEVRVGKPWATDTIWWREWESPRARQAVQ